MKKDNIIGIALCIVLAIPAWIAGKALPIVGASIFGIFIGLIVGHIINTEKIEKGVGITSRKALKLSIILLGFNMNFYNVLKVGQTSFVIITITISLTLAFGYLLNKFLKLDGNTPTLITIGTSICGGSAIAATSPVIKAKDYEIANSMSIIFLFNILAVLFFPPFGMYLSMDDMLFGMWAGNAINDTSSVVAAGLTWNGYFGTETALKIATIVKLTRTLMILPITIGLAIYMTKRAKKENTQGGEYRFIKIFPWFILGFLGAAILNTFISLPFNMSENLALAGKFIIVIAMVAVGVNIDLKKMVQNGFRPLIFGLLCWAVLSSSSLILQNILL